jgi:hypothetical protein
VFVWAARGHFELRTIRPDGTRERVLFDCPRRCLELADPAWSPDGRLVAFTYGDRAFNGVEVMNADGTGIRRLRWDSKQLCCLAWKPS